MGFAAQNVNAVDSIIECRSGDLSSFIASTSPVDAIQPLGHAPALENWRTDLSDWSEGGRLCGERTQRAGERRFSSDFYAVHYQLSPSCTCCTILARNGHSPLREVTNKTNDRFHGTPTWLGSV
ncbi:hypothetical protein HJC23_001495 [Cyclotella cryptica]|uniref:Uncharacterized protein n=1 Tax=Cyclotella cryptica TaxID=29204 RepID=A0ABD3NPN8_9STRA